jgi:hypothetical protein
MGADPDQNEERGDWMSEAAQVDAANVTEASDLIGRYLRGGEWDLAHQVITSYRRKRTIDDAKLAELDPVVMRVLVHLEKALLLREDKPGEAAGEWQWAHRAILEYRLQVEEHRELEPQDVWDLSLAEIGMELRSINVIERELLITTVGELLNVSRGRLLAIPWINANYLSRIVKQLQSVRPLLLDEVNRDRMCNDVSPDWYHQILFGEWPPETA